MSENSLIQTGFGASSTVWDVVEGIDLTGTRAIVTGASSGIGIDTAHALAAVGAEVTLAVRDPAAGERTAAGIRAATGGAVRVGLVDLADLTPINAFLAAWDGRPAPRPDKTMRGGVPVVPPDPSSTVAAGRASKCVLTLYRQMGCL